MKPKNGVNIQVVIPKASLPAIHKAVREGKAVSLSDFCRASILRRLEDMNGGGKSQPGAT